MTIEGFGNNGDQHSVANKRHLHHNRSIVSPSPPETRDCKQQSNSGQYYQHGGVGSDNDLTRSWEIQGSKNEEFGTLFSIIEQDNCSTDSQQAAPDRQCNPFQSVLHTPVKNTLPLDYLVWHNEICEHNSFDRAASSLDGSEIASFETGQDQHYRCTPPQAFKSPVLEGLDKVNQLFSAKGKNHSRLEPNPVEKQVMLGYSVSDEFDYDVDTSFTSFRSCAFSIYEPSGSQANDAPSHDALNKDDRATLGQTMQRLNTLRLEKEDPILLHLRLKKESQLLNLQFEHSFTSLQLQETQMLNTQERKSKVNLEKQTSFFAQKMENIIDYESQFESQLYHKILNLTYQTHFQYESIQHLQNKEQRLQFALFSNQQQITCFERHLNDIHLIVDCLIGRRDTLGINPDLKPQLLECETGMKGCVNSKNSTESKHSYSLVQNDSFLNAPARQVSSIDSRNVEARGTHNYTSPEASKPSSFTKLSENKDNLNKHQHSFHAVVSPCKEEELIQSNRQSSSSGNNNIHKPQNPFLKITSDHNEKNVIQSNIQSCQRKSKTSPSSKAAKSVKKAKAESSRAKKGEANRISRILQLESLLQKEENNSRALSDNLVNADNKLLGLQNALHKNETNLTDLRDQNQCFLAILQTKAKIEIDKARWSKKKLNQIIFSKEGMRSLEIDLAETVQTLDNLLAEFDAIQDEQKSNGIDQGQNSEVSQKMNRMKLKLNVMETSFDAADMKHEDKLKKLSVATNDEMKNILIEVLSDLARVDLESEFCRANMVSSFQTQRQNLNQLKLGLQKLRQQVLDENRVHYIEKDRIIAAKEVECNGLKEIYKELRQNIYCVEKEIQKTKEQLLIQTRVFTMQEDKIIEANNVVCCKLKDEIQELQGQTKLEQKAKQQLQEEMRLYSIEVEKSVEFKDIEICNLKEENKELQTRVSDIEKKKKHKLKITGQQYLDEKLAYATETNKIIEGKDIECYNLKGENRELLNRVHRAEAEIQQLSLYAIEVEKSFKSSFKLKEENRELQNRLYVTEEDMKYQLENTRKNFADETYAYATETNKIIEVKDNECFNLKGENRELLSRVHRAETESQQLKADMDVLMKDMNSYSRTEEVKALYARINSLIGTNTSILNDYGELAERVLKLEDEIQELKSQEAIKNEQLQQETEELINAEETAEAEANRADEAALQLHEALKCILNNEHLIENLKQKNHFLQQQLLDVQENGSRSMQNDDTLEIEILKKINVPSFETVDTESIRTGQDTWNYVIKLEKEMEGLKQTNYLLKRKLQNTYQNNQNIELGSRPINADLEFPADLNFRSSFFPLSQELLDDMNLQDIGVSFLTKELLIFIRTFVSSFGSGDFSNLTNAVGRIYTSIKQDKRSVCTSNLEELIYNQNKDESYEETENKPLDTNSITSFVICQNDDESINESQSSNDFMQEFQSMIFEGEAILEREMSEVRSEHTAADNDSVSGNNENNDVGELINTTLKLLDVSQEARVVEVKKLEQEMHNEIRHVRESYENDLRDQDNLIDETLKLINVTEKSKMAEVDYSLMASSCGQIRNCNEDTCSRIDRIVNMMNCRYLKMKAYNSIRRWYLEWKLQQKICANCGELVASRERIT